MIPESIMYGYFRLSTEQEIRVDKLFQLVSAEAGLLSFWARTLDTSVAPDQILKILGDMESRNLRRIIQSHLLILQSAPVQQTDLEWQNHMQASFVAQALGDFTHPKRAEALQSRVLIALSGLEVPSDALLTELFEFRNVAPEQLADTHPLLRAFACVSQSSVEEEARVAELLFELEQGQYDKICQQADSRCEEYINGLNLPLEIPESWRADLRRAVQLSLYSETLARQKNMLDLHYAYARVCLALFQVAPTCFVLDTKNQNLKGINFPDISISVERSPSMLARCAREDEEYLEQDDEMLCVFDRQLIRRMFTQQIRVLPLKDDNKLVGVLAYPVDVNPDGLLLDEDVLVEQRSAASEFAYWLNNLQQNRSRQTQTLENYRTLHEKKLREIVHEANNPLSIVNNYLHILELRLQNEQGATDQLHMIGEEIRRTSDIIKRVIDVPSLAQDDSSAEDSEHFEYFDITDVLSKVAELSRGYAKNHAIKIDTVLGNNSLVIQSDADKVTQMLVNLSKNAIEAMQEEQQGDALVFEAQSGIYRDGVEGVEILVSDNGPGIPDKVMSSLFEPKTGTRGSGLGLYITFAILQSLNGSMDARTSDSGTVFSLFLPKDQQLVF